MSNYTVTTNFAEKDGFPSGDARKIIKGSDFSGEFNNLATVSAEKANLASPTFTGTVVIPTATITTANTATDNITTANITTANITTANVSGNVDMPDDAKVLLGDNDDLKLYHTGSHSFIEDSGTGSLKLLTSSLQVKNPNDDELILKGTPAGGVDLYYNNNKKLETTDTGVNVTGSFVASAKIGVGIDAPAKPLHIFSETTDVVARIESGDATAGLELIDETSTAQFKVSEGLLTIGTDTDGDVASSNISIRVDNAEKININEVLTVFKQTTRVNDDIGLSFGNQLDMTVTHVSSSNLNTVQNNHNRDMALNGGSFVFQNQAADEKLLELTADGSVDLYHNNAKKLETTATGVSVLGEVAATSADITGNVTATGVTTTDTLVVDKAANGILTEFKIGGTVVGGVRGDLGDFGDFEDVTIGSGNISLRYTGAIAATGSLTGNISPAKISTGGANSGAVDLGYAGSRFDDIYADNGTINTSDATEKQSIEELTEVETRVAVACKGLIRKFKWNSAVEKKGSEARYHFGVIAQDLQVAFAAEGLDAGDYGLFISSTWTDDNGVEQTSLGVRYTELLAFIIGGLV